MLKDEGLTVLRQCIRRLPHGVQRVEAALIIESLSRLKWPSIRSGAREAVRGPAGFIKGPSFRNVAERGGRGRSTRPTSVPPPPTLSLGYHRRLVLSSLRVFHSAFNRRKNNFSFFVENYLEFRFGDSIFIYSVLDGFRDEFGIGRQRVPTL